MFGGEISFFLGLDFLRSGLSSSYVRGSDFLLSGVNSS